MSKTPQKRALRNYRHRLGTRGMARFEVLGLDADRLLIRSLAKRLAENDADAARVRALVSRKVAGEKAPVTRGHNTYSAYRFLAVELDIASP